VKYLSLLYACLALLWAGGIYAADRDDFCFSITPYVWAVSVDGDIEVGVPAEGIPNQLLHISENFKDIFKHVNGGGMFDINANKGKFGLFADVMYVNIKGLEVTTSDEFEVLVDTKFGLYSLGISYKAVEHQVNNYSKIVLEPYVGARYTKNTSSAVLAEAPDDPAFGATYEARWTDPFIGAMLLFDIDPFWSIKLAGDIGGVNKNQDSYDIIGFIAYKPIKLFTISLGYRQFYQSFTTGSGTTYFDWKMHIGGLIAGLTFSF